jgi:NAD dependent epimerase/dehydratase
MGLNWNNNKVLITGAGGFIGSHLTERLVQMGAQVRAFVRYNSRNDWGFLEDISAEILGNMEVFPGDLTDPFMVRRAVTGCQLVFHLGALIGVPYSYDAPRQYIEVNVMGTLNVLKACLEENVEKVIHTSTSETYGTACYTPIDETHPLQSQSPYSASKIAADKLAESYHLSFDLPVAIIRPFNTYGPRQSARAVVPTIISQALCGDIIKLGLLSPVRDLNYVADVVAGFIKVAESEKSVGTVINIGSGRGVVVEQVAEIIIKLIGANKQIVTDEERLRPKKSEVMALICDSTKAKMLLGWKPQYSLEEGLAQTIDYVKKHLNRYKVAIYNR